MNVLHERPHPLYLAPLYLEALLSELFIILITRRSGAS